MPGPKRTVNTDSAAELAAKMLGLGLKKHMIRKAIDSQFTGRQRISPRSFERIMHAAREMLLKMGGKTGDGVRNESGKFYDDILHDPKASITEKLQAVQARDKLYGLRLRRETAPEDDDGVVE